MTTSKKLSELPQRWHRAADGYREAGHHTAARVMYDCANELHRILVEQIAAEIPPAVPAHDWCRNCRTSVALVEGKWRHLDETYDVSGGAYHEVHLG